MILKVVFSHTIISVVIANVEEKISVRILLATFRFRSFEFVETLPRERLVMVSLGASFVL